MAATDSCDLCAGPGGTELWRDDRLRVVLVEDADYPGFTRVVWNAHVRELTDLPADDRAHCMEVVWRVEQAQRRFLAPDKINLASLGNMTPHVHWHVIPRWRGDRHFPGPVWAAPAGPSDEFIRGADGRRARLAEYLAHLAGQLGGRQSPFPRRDEPGARRETEHKHGQG